MGPGLCDLRLCRRLGDSVRRGRLSSAVQGRVLPLEHQSPPGASFRHSRPGQHSGAIAQGAWIEHGFKLPIPSLNRLILQSGLTIGLPRLAAIVVLAALAAFATVTVVRGNVSEALAW